MGQALDRLGLSVRPADDGFQVLVEVNGTDVAASGAGLGMDPYDVLVPTNRLIATGQPVTIPIARCRCGGYGCGATEVTIAREGEVVHWDWSREAAMDRRVSFAAADYDREVARVAADRSWETPDRHAGRLVLTTVDRELLKMYGLRPSWVANDYRNPELFCVTLRLGDDYQVLVSTPWRGRTPQELAREVCAVLSRPPDTWHAAWHGVTDTLIEPPPIAGPDWWPEQVANDSYR